MSVEVKEVVRLDHAPGCKRNKGCGPECKRRRDKGVFKAHITIKVPGRKETRRRLTIPQEFCGTATERDAWAKQEHDKLKTRLTAGARARVPTVAEFKKDFLDYGKASRQTMFYEYLIADFPMIKERVAAMDTDGALKTTSFHTVAYGMLGFIDGVVRKWFRSGMDYPLRDEMPVILEVLFNGFVREGARRQTYFVPPETPDGADNA